MHVSIALESLGDYSLYARAFIEFNYFLAYRKSERLSIVVTTIKYYLKKCTLYYSTQACLLKIFKAITLLVIGFNIVKKI